MLVRVPGLEATGGTDSKQLLFIHRYCSGCRQRALAVLVFMGTAIVKFAAKLEWICGNRKMKTVDLRNQMSATYRSLRLGLAALAMSFPVVLAVSLRVVSVNLVKRLA